MRKERMLTSRVTLPALVFATLSFANAALAQERPPDPPAEDSAAVRAPSASAGGTAKVIPSRTVAEAEDPVNRLVAASTVDALVVAVTIDDATVTLDNAAAARVPRRVTRQRRQTEGDVVKFTGLANGQIVATTVVPDNVLNASEGGGLVRTTRRQIVAALATDRPLDTVRVEANATGAIATLDVRGAYARICEADPGNKWCPRQQR